VSSRLAHQEQANAVEVPLEVQTPLLHRIARNHPQARGDHPRRHSFGV